MTTYEERAAERAAGRAPTEVVSPSSTGELNIPTGRGHADLDRKRNEQQLRWVHIPAHEPVLLTLACETPISYTGHYTGGRIVPCLGKHRCQYCGTLGTKERWVAAVHVLRDPRLSLLDYGIGLAEDLERIADENFGSLAGVQVEAFRSPAGRFGVAHADWHEYEFPGRSDETFGLTYDELLPLVHRNLECNLPRARR